MPGVRLDYHQPHTPDPKLDRDRRTIRLVIEFIGGLWCVAMAGPIGGMFIKPTASWKQWYAPGCVIAWFLGVRLLVRGRRTLRADRDGRIADILADRCVLVGMALAIIALPWIGARFAD